MEDYAQLLGNVKIPGFVKVKYKIPHHKIDNISRAVCDALVSSHVLCDVHAGMRIAIAAGSRKIADYPVIMRTLIDAVKATGAQVFLVPAMGSHGGATAEGQIAILQEYGITEESMGVPILATMETVSLGKAENGMEVHLDRYASEADGIIVFNRIKAHTGFRGAVESGLMKMITIGLGKQHGASVCHSDRPENMSINIQTMASYAIAHAKILFGVGVVEDAYHDPAMIRAMKSGDIFRIETEMLKEAKAMMPSIPFQKADILFIDEIGKDIAGEGMDPNITGRSFFIGNKEPFFESIAVLDITNVSEGNGTGIGNADVITRRAFDKFRMDMVYPNCITSRDAKSTKLPVTMPSDKLAFQFALNMCYGIDWIKGPGIVWLKNTLRLDTFYISEGLIEQAKENPDIEITGILQAVSFNQDGDVIDHEYEP